MTRPQRSLLVHVLGGAVLAGVVVAVCALFDLRLSLPILMAAGLASGTALWAVRRRPARADHLDGPRLDLDADYALPHGQDIRVRRLEDMIHGAQPNRRMTARSLARTLAEIADERARDPQAPPLSPQLTDLLERAATADAEASPLRPIDRRTLHRHLRELAATGE
ncbi:hypothetical protein ACT3SP_12040 [Brachybacterium sp. AOP43-C2-M15]|uniref:hypothetical protein n=1 Tax=Brachybacterium sp. AOP43-C2-M15 TaxID=3457661 RepID=UPI004033AB4A